MNLLLIHNNYGVYSGEEAVVDQQIALFRELGHTVQIYRKTTEGERGTMKGNIKGLFQGFYSPSSVRDVKRLLCRQKPDVVVVHNLYPYISPAILEPIHRAGIPIVMTIHNYRLVCPTGLFMRGGQPCELCLQKGNEWSCIRYNCEGSLLKSVGYAGRNWFARITKAYKSNVTIYACITKFQQEKLVQAGFDREKFRYIPNTLDKIANHSDKKGDYVAIVGRLSFEKGIDIALRVAKQTPDIKYCFAGSPRDEEPIIAEISNNCILLGHLSKSELNDFYQNARFLLNMSRCYEGFPMTLLEAASYGKPSIGPAHGGFPEIIDDGITGLLFRPGDENDLKEKIEYLWNAPELSVRMGQSAFAKLQTNYTSDIIKQRWQELFDSLKPF